MVLVNMLMEIDPRSMRGSLVMTMALIPPPGGKFPWKNSSVRALDCFCKFRLETAVLRPESFLMNFPGTRHHIAEDGNRKPGRGPTRSGGVPRG